MKLVLPLLTTLSALLHSAAAAPVPENQGAWEKRCSFLRGRSFRTAGWTYSEMIVWGGGSQLIANMNTGGRYNPATEKWTSTAIDGAPAGRGIFTSVWTDEGILIYGGSTGGTAAFNKTYFYSPTGKPPEK